MSKHASGRASRYSTLLGGALWVLLALAPAPSRGQEAQPREPQPAVVFETVDVRVLNVEVFVTDRQGQPVVGLTADDFRLFADGEEVPISNFYTESGGKPTPAASRPPRDGAVPSPGTRTTGSTAPATPSEQSLRIVVYVDNANIRPSNRKQVFTHLRQFLDSRLAQDDSVSVVSYGPSLRIHSDFLNDRGTVHRILDELEGTSVRGPSTRVTRRQLLNEIFEGTAMRTGPARTETTDDFRAGPQLNEIRAYAQEEFSYSKAALASLEGLIGTLGGVPGRKALLYVSDGIANRPGEDLFLGWRERYRTLRDRRYATLESDYEHEVGLFDLLGDFRTIATTANQAQVTVYVIDAESDHIAELRTAALSGGIADEARSALEVNIRDPLESVAVATGGQRFQASDLLGEQLGRIASDFDSYYSLGFAAGPDHDRRPKIEVKLKEGKGLIVRHRERLQLKAATERMSEATIASLLYQAGDNPLGISLESGRPQERTDGNAVLPLKVKIPIQGVALVPTGGIYGSQLSIYVSVKDRAGQPRPVQRLPFHFQVPADKLEEVKGLVAAYDLPVILREGDQQVAIGVRDDVAGVGSTVRLELTAIQ